MRELRSTDVDETKPVRLRAAEYVRMSTEHQQYSTQNQADKIREYAAHRGIEIVRTYADEGKSGLRLDGLSPSRSPPRLLNAAAPGDLKPAPASRLREAYSHLQYSTTGLPPVFVTHATGCPFWFGASRGRVHLRHSSSS